MQFTSNALTYVSMPNGTTQIGIVQANGKIKLANKYGEYVIDAPTGALANLSKNSNDVKSNAAPVSSVGLFPIAERVQAYGGSFTSSTHGSNTLYSLSSYGMNNVPFNLITPTGLMGIFTDASGTNRSINIVNGFGGYRVENQSSAEALYVYLVESNGKQIANLRRTAYAGNSYNGKKVNNLQGEANSLEAELLAIEQVRNVNSLPSNLRNYYHNANSLIPQINMTNANSSFDSDIDNFRNIYSNNEALYARIAQSSGIPQELVAAIHYRESGGNFNTYLHNGQPLGTPTTIIPVGRIFYDFESAAVDALVSEQASKGIHLSSDMKDMTMLMTFAEIYNGTGYTDYRGIASPYVYSGTNVYTSGKYTSDGRFDSEAIDQQPGIYILMNSISK